LTVEAADFVYLLQDLACQRHFGQTKAAWNGTTCRNRNAHKNNVWFYSHNL